MLKMFVALLRVLVWMVVCMVVGILSALTIHAFTVAGIGWLGVLVTVSIAVGVGAILADFL